MLEFLGMKVDEKKEIIITLKLNGENIEKQLTPSRLRPENRNVVINGIAEAVEVNIPQEIRCHFSFLQETSVEITCNNGNGSFSNGIKGYGSSKKHGEYNDLWACAIAFTDWVNKSNLIN